MAGGFTLVSALFVGLLAWYILSQGRNVSNVRERADPEYDYVIVGAGSAGSVVAARLSEDATVKVLLLEAGPEETDDPVMSVPLMNSLLMNSKYTWQERSIPQNHSCLDNDEKRCLLPIGRGLGGGSSHNGLMYVRGPRQDYDRWASYGCKGWSYADVLPYFIRAENNKNPELKKSPYHGTEGPLSVEDNSVTDIGQAYIEAAKELGHKHLDVNGKDQEGFAIQQLNTNKGVRCSTSKAYLRPSMHRDNLHVVTHAYASRVLLEGKRAVGVEYIHWGVVKSVKASKEVMLSAGSLATPKLLMLSGIGPKEHLQGLGIPVVADLPVGDNLQDHLWTEYVQITTNPGTAITPSAIASWTNWAQYQLFGTGIYAMGAGVQGTGFYKVPSSKPSYYVQSALFGALIRPNEDAQDDLTLDEVFHDQDGGMLTTGLLRPYSRGTLRLASTNPLDRPLIDTQYLSDPRDVRMLIEGIRVNQKLAQTQALRKIGAETIHRVHPRCRHLTYDSDEYVECVLRHNTFSCYHFSGTCKMGETSDKTAVLDPQLRVRGIEGLRVADTSIMPDIIEGNTNAAAIMIGEKAADLIRGQTLEPLHL